MKVLTLILYLLIGTEAALALMALPPVNDTNKLAEIYRANSINAAWQNYYYINGRVDRLEHEVNRLESGFTILTVLIGSALMAACVLATRDRIRERKSIQESGSESNANQPRR